MAWDTAFSAFDVLHFRQDLAESFIGYNGELPPELWRLATE